MVGPVGGMTLLAEAELPAVSLLLSQGSRMARWERLAVSTRFNAGLRDKTVVMHILWLLEKSQSMRLSRCSTEAWMLTFVRACARRVSRYRHVNGSIDLGLALGNVDRG
jgi:hypothetical protein